MTFGADSYLSGSPDFIFEVSASAVSIDLGKKLNAYRRKQVAEYGVWRVYDAAVDWFVFRAGRFQPLVATVLAELSRGIARPEHATFVQRLAARRTS